MGRVIRFVAAAAFAAGLGSASAWAEPFDDPMTFRLESGAYPCWDSATRSVKLARVVNAEGVIVRDALQRFVAFFQANPPVPGCTRIAFNSPGGNLGVGMKLGEAIRALGLVTTIGKYSGVETPGTVFPRLLPGTCQSACAFAFLGGVRRYAQSHQYGVHRFYNCDPARDAQCRLAQDGMASGQIIMAELQRFIITMGARPELLQVMVQAGNRRDEPQMLFLTAGLMAELKVTTPPFDASWEIVNERGAAAVLGVIRGANEMHAVLFGCERGAGAAAVQVTVLHQGKDKTGALSAKASIFVRAPGRGLRRYGGPATKVVLTEGSVLKPLWLAVGPGRADAWSIRLAPADLADIVLQERLELVPMLRFGSTVVFEIASARQKIQGLIGTCR